MLSILPDDISATHLYKLMAGIVVPRPIAWVTSMSPNRVVNLAPFSCFTFVPPKPPMVGITVGTRDGKVKDTARNILETGEFAVNIADESMIEAIHPSAEEHPPEVSEVELLGLNLKASERIRTPCLAEVPISMGCRLERSISFGSVGSHFMIGEGVAFHVRSGLCTDYKIDTGKLRPESRIAGPNYAALGRITAMQG